VSVECGADTQCDSWFTWLSTGKNAHGCQSASCYVLHQSYSIYWLQFRLWTSGYCVAINTSEKPAASKTLVVTYNTTWCHNAESEISKAFMCYNCADLCTQDMTWFTLCKYTWHYSHTSLHIKIMSYFIYSGNKCASSVGGVDHYIIIRKLKNYILPVSPVGEIRTLLHGTFIL
jgi:hypothetical protein